jgi:predicted nucleic acid-binding protein
VIVDASLVIKLYVQEAHSEASVSLFEAASRVAALSHMLGEVGEVLTRRFLAGSIRRSQLDRALHEVAERVEAIPITLLLETAVEIAVTTSISFYDALYVAAAEDFGRTLITADAKLVRKIEGSPWQSRVELISAWYNRRQH